MHTCCLHVISVDGVGKAISKLFSFLMCEISDFTLMLKQSLANVPNIFEL
jgi:hypothetical protein